MLQYLGRDYLSEYLARVSQFLTQSLLTVPSVEDYVSQQKKTNNEDLLQICLQDLPNNVDDKNINDLIQSQLDVMAASATSNFSNHSSHLESYNPKEEKAKDIIEIDSDSDCDFSSLDQEIFVSSYTLSLCSRVFQRSIDKLELEEPESFELKENCVPILNLCRRLRPVRVMDPFKASSSKKSMIEVALQKKKKEAIVEWSYDKIDLDKDIEPLLIEDVVWLDDKDYSSEKDRVLIVSKVIQIEPLEVNLEEQEEGLFRQISLTNSTIQLEQYNTKNENDTEDEGSWIPFCIADECHERLDSPMSECGSLLCWNYDEIKDACSQEYEQDKVDIEILSATRKDEIEKYVWNKDKIYGDMLLMLLAIPDNVTVSDNSDLLSLPCMQTFRKYCMLSNDHDGELEWDPLLHAKEQISSAKNVLLADITVDAATAKEVDLEPMFKYFVLKLSCKETEDEVVLENWKEQGDQIIFLQYITEYKRKTICGGGLTSAPIESRKNVISDAKSACVEVEKPLIHTSKPTSYSTMASTSSQTPKMNLTPLDSFIFLRTGKILGQKTSYSGKSVSACKVKPMTHGSDAKQSLARTVTPVMCEADIKRNVAPVRPRIQVNNIQHSSNLMGNEFIETSTPIGLFDNRPTTSLQLQSEKTSDLNETWNSEGEVNRCSSIGHRSATIINKSQTVLDITLPNEFSEIISDIDRNSWSLMQFLKDSKCIGESVILSSLTPDLTRFMLKEEIRRQRQGQSNTDIHCGILCLHAFVQVIDLMVNCNLPVACAVLKSYSHDHQSILRNCLEPVRKQICSFHCRNEDRGKLHPKLLKIQYCVETWLKRDPQMKLLVLIGRYHDNISISLQSFLSAIKNVFVNMYPVGNVTESVYVNAFSNANVILAQESEVLQTCPWEYFQYVIQYEYRKDSCWHETAFASNPDLKAFVSLRVTLETSIQISGTNVPTTTNRSMQHTVLCSKDAIFHREFLVALENKENIKIILKECSISTNEFVYQPDFLLDERTAILLVHVDTEQSVFFQKILSVVLKCSVCHLIIVITDDSLRNNISQLLSGITCMLFEIKKDFPDVHCNIFYAFSIHELTETCRMLCDMALKYSTVWTHEQWLDRNWLTAEMSAKEQFLLSYPCINSFCAQIMIQSRLPLHILLSATLEELQSFFKWIPNRILKTFYSINHCIPKPQEPLVVNLIENVEPPVVHNEPVVANRLGELENLHDDGFYDNPHLRTKSLPDTNRHRDSRSSRFALSNVSIDNYPGLVAEHPCLFSIEPNTSYLSPPAIKPMTIEEMIKEENKPFMQANEELCDSLDIFFVKSSQSGCVTNPSMIKHQPIMTSSPSKKYLPMSSGEDYYLSAEKLLSTRRWDPTRVGYYENTHVNSPKEVLSDMKSFTAMTDITNLSQPIQHSTSCSLLSNNQSKHDNFHVNSLTAQCQNENNVRGEQTTIRVFDTLPTTSNNRSDNNIAHNRTNERFNFLEQPVEATEKLEEGHFNPLWYRKLNTEKNIPRQAVKAFRINLTQDMSQLNGQYNRNFNGEKTLQTIDQENHAHQTNRIQLTTSRTNMKYAGETPRSVSSRKRKRLTYEKVAGAKNGQTRLAFI